MRLMKNFRTRSGTLLNGVKLCLVCCLLNIMCFWEKSDFCYVLRILITWFVRHVSTTHLKLICKKYSANVNNIYTCIRRAAFGTWSDCLLQLFYYFYLTLNDHSINRVNVAWNNSFRHIFSGFWWESVKPLQYYTATLPISYFMDQRKLLFKKIGHT